MKRLLTVLTVLMLITTPVWAGMGPDKGQSAATIGAGASLPMGDFGDVAKTGLVFGAGYGFFMGPQMEVGG